MRDNTSLLSIVNCRAGRTRLSFDIAAAHHAADIRATLERQGRAIGGYDILIAGHARSRALIVVTGNRGEFDRVPGLQCEDWG
jgi:tRNA(fMet)-specific endonuclease VapC